MERRKKQHDDVKLNKVRRMFEHWRNNKAYPGEKIPKHLWQAAAGLAGSVTLTVIAKELGLGWNELKSAVKKSEAAKKMKKMPVKGKTVTFLELAEAGPTQARSQALAAMELERADGVKLRFYPEALSRVDLAAIVGQFIPSIGQ